MLYSTKTQNLWSSSSSKILKNFTRDKPQPQKTSKFEDEAEDLETLMSQMPTLEYAMFF